jgi:hypothetical protein
MAFKEQSSSSIELILGRFRPIRWIFLKKMTFHLDFFVEMDIDESFTI